jgi:CheY-like chemotaxis protein
LLAGRILLLADDSITIQKVVDLTFADEGVKVISVGNGREAIEKLNETVPDVVLADVFMPEMTGYEVCEYIKHNEKLKHVPVVLLVGSFEPFDEAEARRVGADDTLTKPFQSIRKLIDRVGGLVSARPPQEEIATAELPRAEREEPQQLSTQELAITTADTRPLPPELEEMASQSGKSATPSLVTAGAPKDEDHMEQSMNAPDNGLPVATEVSDQLLDLDDLAVSDGIDEEFVLDLEFSEDEPEMAEASSTGARVFIEPQVTQPSKFEETFSTIEYSTHQFAQTQEFPAPSVAPERPESEIFQTVQYGNGQSDVQQPSQLVRVTDDAEASAPAQVTANESGRVESGALSPEVIDAIARRVVERMSTTVIQEIAWEVVPQLAELMIKRQLEEKKS